MSFTFKKVTAMKVLKYGAVGTAGLAFGAAAGSFRDSDPQWRSENTKSALKAGVVAGALVTGAVLARKPLSKIAVGAFKGAYQAAKNYGGKVVFRRIRGRIVPVKLK